MYILLSLVFMLNVWIIFRQSESHKGLLDAIVKTNKILRKEIDELREEMNKNNS